MEKVITTLHEWIDKIGKHNILLILFIFTVTLVAGLYTTFSIYTTADSSEIIDGLTTYKFILNADSSKNSASIAANSTKNMDITVSNNANTKLKYGVYYSSNDDLTDVSINYLPSSQYSSTGLIEANSDYIVTIRIVNNSSSNIKIDFGLSFGLEKGGDLVLDSNNYWIPEPQYLNTAPSGSYVEYIGNNGCTGENCSGMNANSSATNNGYCQNENYQYSQSGWRIAYIESDSVYLVSAGSPECLCTNSDGNQSNNVCNSNEKTAGAPIHIANLNKAALKYCNSIYAADGICDSTTTWAMNEKDFIKITGTESKLCYDSVAENKCGYDNDLIDIEGQYWLATPTTNEINPNYHIQNWLALERTVSDNQTNDAFGIRPIIKLDKKVYIIGGTGTSIDPYKISS